MTPAKSWRLGRLTWNRVSLLELGRPGSFCDEVLAEPAAGPSVWRGDELTNAERWIVPFTEEDLIDFERALAFVSAKHVREFTDIRADDFPLPRFRERLEDIVDRLENGLGLVLLRGLPIYDRFVERAGHDHLLGAGRHLGHLVPQNRKGDLIGHIRDLGRRGPYERAYATNEDLGFHTDSTDFVGLMCLRPALYGGESFVASSGLLYNMVIDEHPEYLPILNKKLPDRLEERGAARISRLVPGAALQLLRRSALRDRQDWPGNVGNALR